MEMILYLLVATIGLAVAAKRNYRRSILKAKEVLQLKKEAEQSLQNAHLHFQEAAQARQEAQQVRKEAAKVLEDVQRYWEMNRLN